VRLLVGPLVGVLEIVCWALIVVGLGTRLATLALIVIMVVAIVSTKIPVLLGHDLWIFHRPQLRRYGFCSVLHEAHLDFAMPLGLLYLLMAGAGAWSLEARLSRAMLRSRVGS